MRVKTQTSLILGGSLSLFRAVSLVFCLGLLSCTDAHQGKAGTHWPDGLNVVGYGFPDTGDACRQLNESPAIKGHVEGLHLYVGCPKNTPQIVLDKINARYHAKQITDYQGISILAIPLE